MMQLLDKPTTGYSDLAHVGSWTGGPDEEISTRLKITSKVSNRVCEKDFININLR